METCKVCTAILAAFTVGLECGAVYPLPNHDLIMWEDGTYTAMPALRPHQN